MRPSLCWPELIHIVVQYPLAVACAVVSIYIFCVVLLTFIDVQI
jgi:hypothetical protein